MTFTARSIGLVLRKNSPQILTGMAVVGVIGTVVLAVRATPEAVREIHDAQIDLRDTSENEDAPLVDLTPRQIVETTWRIYLPAAVTGAATLACIIGSNAIGVRRQVAALGAYAIVDRAFAEYKDKVIEQFGEAKERKVHDAIAVERLTSNPPQSEADVILTGKGNTLCYDTFSGRYFRSDMETIRQAQNTINGQIFHDMYIELDAFYELLGLRSTTLGQTHGFNIDNPVELVFTSHLSDGGEPALAIGWTKLPKYDYGKVF